MVSGGAAYPAILAGVKDSSGDWDNTRRLIERFPELAGKVECLDNQYR